ncbi:MAG: putative oxidoreductase [Ilumatobacteraceae bacterium]|nr:putative oxidoreductase [Ilumatobacteraceae bacterium]
MQDQELFDLTGRRAVVTGAAGLLGREFAGALAAAGAHVVLVDRDEAATAAVAATIAEEAAVAPTVLALDITDPAAVGPAIEALAEVDILVNSAAIDPKFEPGAELAGHLTHYSLEKWKASLDVNLTGSFLMTQACCRLMEQQGDRGRGAIVNLSSTYGLGGPDQRIYRGADGQKFFKPVDYSVTKAGMLGFTRAVAALYAGTEIRVNALTPGGAFNGQDDEFVQQYSARTILGRMAAPADYRGAMVFLCSDASRYMTGANLVVDGGWTAW